MKEVAKIVIYDKEKFLLQLRDNKPSINYPDTWSFFGGEVDRGEKHDVALIRELKERKLLRKGKGRYRFNIKKLILY